VSREASFLFPDLSDLSSFFPSFLPPFFKVSICSQAGLKLSILLPQPPKCWDYRRGPHAQLACLVYFPFSLERQVPPIV
jgi:hypothetical protein